MDQAKAMPILVLWQIASLATFIHLVLHATYNWWNWILIVPISGFLAEIWPIYWALLYPFFDR